MDRIIVNQDRDTPSQQRRRIGLWFCMLGPPLLWYANMQIDYLFVRLARNSHRMWPIHLSDVASLVICLGFGLWAWSMHRSPINRDDPDASQRERFMTVVGVAGSAFFLLIILAQSIPSFVLNPRWG
jgi:hypothetical protein